MYKIKRFSCLDQKEFAGTQAAIDNLNELARDGVAKKQIKKGLMDVSNKTADQVKRLNEMAGGNKSRLDAIERARLNRENSMKSAFQGTLTKPASTTSSKVASTASTNLPAKVATPTATAAETAGKMSKFKLGTKGKLGLAAAGLATAGAVGYKLSNRNKQ